MKLFGESDRKQGEERVFAGGRQTEIGGERQRRECDDGVREMQRGVRKVFVEK